MRDLDEAAQVYLTKGYVLSYHRLKNAVALIKYSEWVQLAPAVRYHGAEVTLSRPYVVIDQKGHVTETTFVQYHANLEGKNPRVLP